MRLYCIQRRQIHKKINKKCYYKKIFIIILKLLIKFGLNSIDISHTYHWGYFCKFYMASNCLLRCTFFYSNLLLLLAIIGTLLGIFLSYLN